jgi:hypothetical protein
MFIILFYFVELWYDTNAIVRELLYAVGIRDFVMPIYGSSRPGANGLLFYSGHDCGVDGGYVDKFRFVHEFGDLPENVTPLNMDSDLVPFYQAVYIAVRCTIGRGRGPGHMWSPRADEQTALTLLNEMVNPKQARDASFNFAPDFGDGKRKAVACPDWGGPSVKRCFTKGDLPQLSGPDLCRVFVLSAADAEEYLEVLGEAYPCTRLDPITNKPVACTVALMEAARMQPGLRVFAPDSFVRKLLISLGKEGHPGPFAISGLLTDEYVVACCQSQPCACGFCGQGRAECRVKGVPLDGPALRAQRVVWEKEALDLLLPDGSFRPTVTRRIELRGVYGQGPMGQTGFVTVHDHLKQMAEGTQELVGRFAAQCVDPEARAAFSHLGNLLNAQGQLFEHILLHLPYYVEEKEKRLRPLQVARTTYKYVNYETGATDRVERSSLVDKKGLAEAVASFKFT